jgi:hypothetical protein
MRYEIEINDEGFEIVDLSTDDPEEIAANLGLLDYMENFEIIEDGMYLTFTGTFIAEAVEDYEGVRNLIEEIKLGDYIKDIRKFQE